MSVVEILCLPYKKNINFLMYLKRILHVQSGCLSWNFRKIYRKLNTTIYLRNSQFGLTFGKTFRQESVRTINEKKSLQAKSNPNFINKLKTKTPEILTSYNLITNKLHLNYNMLKYVYVSMVSICIRYIPQANLPLVFKLIFSA